MAKYVGLMKRFNRSIISPLINDNIKYLTINKLLVVDILVNISNMQYLSDIIRYILITTLEKQFKKVISNQKKTS